jgi:hypothetical protein
MVGLEQRRDEATRRRRWKCPHRWYEDALQRFDYGDERALWFAVLDNAIQAVRGKLNVPRKPRRFLAAEARAWIRDNASEPLGTFVSICRELNLDIDTVRADILAIEFIGQTAKLGHLRLVTPRREAAA